MEQRSRKGLKDEGSGGGEGCILCRHSWEFMEPWGHVWERGNSDLTECKYKGPEAGVPGVLEELQGRPGWLQRVDGFGV